MNRHYLITQETEDHTHLVHGVLVQSDYSFIIDVSLLPLIYYDEQHKYVLGKIF